MVNVANAIEQHSGSLDVPRIRSLPRWWLPRLVIAFAVLFRLIELSERFPTSVMLCRALHFTGRATVVANFKVIIG